MIFVFTVVQNLYHAIVGGMNKMRRVRVDDFFEGMLAISFLLFILFLFFIFQGDPDIWDLVHRKVIHWLS